jgi:hypothetical protein
VAADSRPLDDKGESTGHPGFVDDDDAVPIRDAHRYLYGLSRESGSVAAGSSRGGSTAGKAIGRREASAGRLVKAEERVKRLDVGAPPG